jgi:hypothetical protein
MLEGITLPDALREVRVRARYELTLSGDPPAATATVAEADGRAWAVQGTAADGRRYLLVASPLDAAGTSLPVSTGMLRFVDWVASEWAGAGGTGAARVTGTHLPAPGSATHVRFPDGDEREIDGTRTVRGTGQAGFYSFLAADTVVSVVALNPPVEESRLAPLDEDVLADRIGPEVVDVSRSANAWGGEVFRARQGPELWWPFLLAALALLALETLMATSSGRNPLARSRGREPATDGID